jgi:hypothetical protein
MNHIAQEIVFQGKKPSQKQVFTRALERVNKGDTLIEIYWGENGITLDQQRINGIWCGFGWIKDIEGDAIAKQINATMQRNTLNLWNT